MTTELEQLADRADEIVAELNRLGELWFEARVVRDFPTMDVLELQLDELRREGKRIERREHKLEKRLGL